MTRLEKRRKRRKSREGEGTSNIKKRNKGSKERSA